MKYFFREPRDPFERTRNPHLGWKSLTNMISRDMSRTRDGDEEYDAEPIYASPVVSTASADYRDLLSPETLARLEAFEARHKKGEPL